MTSTTTQTTAAPNPAPTRAEALASPGKYLTIALGDESYGIPVLKVREIIRLCPITRVANMPAHVRGVINLRGKVIPVVDLRTRFGLSAGQDHDRTCIVVAQVAATVGTGTRPYGVIVDGVEEVANFSAADIQPTPDFGGAIDTRFITGMARQGDAVKSLIDLDAIAASESTPIEGGAGVASSTPS
ncbi:MAG: chemotaxis protein CheW [Planctomycetia bacterium]